MHLRILFAGFLLGLASSGACRTSSFSWRLSSNHGHTRDAGADGLPEVGEHTTGQFCESLCGPGLMVCRRVEELVLKCQPGCE